MAYIFYIDESGTANLKDQQGRFFVLTAFGVKLTKWRDIEQSLEDLKARFFPGIAPHDVEIKGSALRARRGAFKDLTEQERDEIIKALIRLIEVLDDVFITAVVIDKCRLRSAYHTPRDPYDLAFEYLVERIQFFLQDADDHGVLVMDSRGSNGSLDQGDLRMLALLRAFQRWATGFQQITRIVEQPFFVDSHFSVGVQLADFISYAVYRCFDRNSPWEGWMPLIQSKFRRVHGRLDGRGLKIFPDDDVIKRWEKEWNDPTAWNAWYKVEGYKYEEIPF